MDKESECYIWRSKVLFPAPCEQKEKFIELVLLFEGSTVGHKLL